MGFEGMCAVLGALWTTKCLPQATGPSSLSLSVSLPGSLALSLVARGEQKGGGALQTAQIHYRPLCWSSLASSLD